MTNSKDEEHGDHTYLHPFCSDAACPDKEDTDATNDLNDMVQEGLMAPGEASNIHAGKLSNYGW